MLPVPMHKTTKNASCVRSKGPSPSSVPEYDARAVSCVLCPVKGYTWLQLNTSGEFSSYYDFGQLQPHISRGEEYSQFHFL